MGAVVARFELAYALAHALVTTGLGCDLLHLGILAARTQRNHRVHCGGLCGINAVAARTPCVWERARARTQVLLPQ